MTDEPSPETENAPEDARRADAMKKARRMMVWTVAILALVMVLAILVLPSQFMDLRWSVLLKLGAGVAGTILLAAGLMAASFYSDTSGHDDDAPGV